MTGISKINSDLCKISTWSKSHGLTLNASKSQAAIIGNPRQTCKIDFNTTGSIVLNNSTIPFSATVKNLGLFIDSSFSWIPQTNYVSRRLFAAVGSLKRWKNLLPIKTKISLAETLLLPILDYADSSYTDLNEELLNKLERLQNLCIRFIYGLRKFDHITEYHQKALECDNKKLRKRRVGIVRDRSRWQAGYARQADAPHTRTSLVAAHTGAAG
nr:uncharacterized protein LOC117982578 [Maniola hyperantus]